MNSLRTRIIDRRISRNISMQLQSLATSTSAVNEIQIPVRKERGPTDILKALESTISRDPTAPNYKFIDDPFVIPTSIGQKRTYTLARESGKKAAMWVMQEHSDLLKSNLSEPLIQAFLPRDKYENKDQVSEEILIKLIKKGSVGDALYVYSLLEEDVSKEAKQALLELLCFYNSDTNQIPEEFPEEWNFQRDVEIKKNMWITSPEVQKLFEELKNDKEISARAYNALICGTAKYLEVDQAMQLYNYCADNNLPLSLTAYNNLIQLVPLIKDNNKERNALLLDFLKSIVNNGIRPDIQTLNAALKSLSSLKTQENIKEFALNLLTEFKSIGIKPCLTSYYHILQIFYKQGSGSTTSNALLEILDELEKEEELIIQDSTDVYFFCYAMEIASQHMHNLSAGDRLHKLFLTKDNYKFIGGQLKENIYYRHYFHLHLTTETLDEFMKLYDDLVPNVYVPEPAIMKEILDILEFNDKTKASELLPRFLSQIIQFDMLERVLIMDKALSLMIGHCSPPKNSPIHKQYADIALAFWTHIQDTQNKRLKHSLWSQNAYGNVGILLLRGDEFEKMLEVLHFLLKSQNSTVGSLDLEKLQELFDACIVRGHVPGALIALEYAHDFGLSNTNLLAQTLRETLPLSPAQENQCINLAGTQGFKSGANTYSKEKINYKNIDIDALEPKENRLSFKAPSE